MCAAAEELELAAAKLVPSAGFVVLAPLLPEEQAASASSEAAPTATIFTTGFFMRTIIVPVENGCQLRGERGPCEMRGRWVASDVGYVGRCEPCVACERCGAPICGEGETRGVLGGR